MSQAKTFYFCSLDTWGCNADGQLGHVSEIGNQLTPMLVNKWDRQYVRPSTIKQVSLGDQFTLICTGRWRVCGGFVSVSEVNDVNSLFLLKWTVLFILAAVGLTAPSAMATSLVETSFV